MGPAHPSDRARVRRTVERAGLQSGAECGYREQGAVSSPRTSTRGLTNRNTFKETEDLFGYWPLSATGKYVENWDSLENLRISLRTKRVSPSVVDLIN